MKNYEPRIVGEWVNSRGRTYPVKLCHFEHCDYMHYSRGLCSGHYERMRRGDELPGELFYKDRSKPPCVFNGCPHLAMGYAEGYCSTHHGQVWKFGRAREVKFYMMLGFTDEGRICKDCNEEKPLSEFYKRNHKKSPHTTTYSTQCKKCYMIDVSYNQGRVLWKADGSDPLGWQTNPEAMKAKQEATYARQRVTSRLYAQKKRDEKNA